MRPSRQINRYALVENPRETSGERAPVRRFALARLGPARRSALGEDRHERLERVADGGRPATQ